MTPDKLKELAEWWNEWATLRCGTPDGAKAEQTAAILSALAEAEKARIYRWPLSAGGVSPWIVASHIDTARGVEHAGCEYATALIIPEKP